MGEQSLLFYEREIFLQKSITLWLPQEYKEQIAKQTKPYSGIYREEFIMKMRIMTLLAVLMMGLSSICMAHVSGGSIDGMINTSVGPKVAIYTCEGYSVGTIVEYPGDYPLEDHDVIEALNGGYLTQVGYVSVKDLRTGSSGNVFRIDAVGLSEYTAKAWLANGGSF